MPCALSAGGPIVWLPVPEEQVAVPDCVAAPPIDQLTVVESPGAVPHEPPNELRFAFVLRGKLTVEPFTFVSVTAGGVLSMVVVTVFEAAVLPALSVTWAWTT
jgi:hypothetical protein